ncbi:hypothetical protein BT93_H0205 [Corymbia citriodora subsp. variegata]|nr:hypothetical protein BT93_H0205 [Corymbia citriodora subsp. variegata]
MFSLYANDDSKSMFQPGESDWDSFPNNSALSKHLIAQTLKNTLFEGGDGANTFHAFYPTQAKKTYSMVIVNHFWSQIFRVAFYNKLTDLWLSTLRVVNLALNLCAYDFVSREIHATKDSKFETLHLKYSLKRRYSSLDWQLKISTMKTYIP